MVLVNERKLLTAKPIQCIEYIKTEGLVKSSLLSVLHPSLHTISQLMDHPAGFHDFEVTFMLFVSYFMLNFVFLKTTLPCCVFEHASCFEMFAHLKTET